MATPSDVELANLSIRAGLLNKEQAIECLKEVHALSLKGTVKSVSEIFVERGLLSAEQLTKLRAQLQQVQAAGSAPTQQTTATQAVARPPAAAQTAAGARTAPGQDAGPQTHTTSPAGPRQPTLERRAEPEALYPPIIERRTETPGGPQAATRQPTKPTSGRLPSMGTQAKPPLAPAAQAQPPGGAPAGRQTPSAVHHAPPSPTTLPTAGKPVPQTHKAPTPPPKPTQPQDPIPGYKIVGKIGMGGMATVFKALDSKNANQVIALKILFPHHAKNEVFLQRFIRESELLVKFDHVNIVRGYDHGVANTLYYLAMEFIEGRSVQNMIDDTGSLKEETALDIVLQIARALAYIQDHGIVHRDVKPDNVLVTPDGVVKLCDLGFAKPLGGPSTAAATEEVTCGTPQYMSPEQAQGEMALDIRSDIYALGATLYHMALGTLPFKGTDNMEIMAKQVLESLDSQEVKSRKISKHMHYFIERMMSKDKDFRYQSPHEMIEDIETQMEGWRTLQFNPEEAETSLGGFLKKPLRSQPSTGKDSGRRKFPDRSSTRFLRRKP